MECRDISVGITTRYGLRSPVIESQWMRDFPCPSRQLLRTKQPPVHWVSVCSLVVKWTQPDAELLAFLVRNSFQLHLTSPLCLHRRFLGRPLP